MTDLAVIVPVLGRPHRAQPLADSLAAATTADYRLVFVCSHNDLDEIRACAETDATLLLLNQRPGPGDYARKIQLGFDSTTAPFVFQGADDLDFRPGWDTAALTAIEREQTGVCGTNDGANSKVQRGMHSTHSLIRRSYIDECGGSLDGPGIVLSHAYDHQFVDTELVNVAMWRDCWSFAPDSVVIHSHPTWGTAPTDATYQRGQAGYHRDAALFRQRARAWGGPY